MTYRRIIESFWRREMKTRSYTNFIILGFVLSGIYAICFLLMRLRLAFETFENFSLQSAFSEEFAKMFQMGFILDMRAICIVFAVFIAFAFLTKINQILLKNRYGGGHLINSSTLSRFVLV